MKILFLLYHGFSQYSGISKKIWAQVEGLRQNGHQVDVCTYMVDEDGHRKRMMNDEVLEDYGTGAWAKIRKRCCYGSIVDYCRTRGVDLVYVRSFHNANPFTIHLFARLRRSGIRCVQEIPTYPYDPEYTGAGRRVLLNLWIDRLFRRTLARKADAIVTFSGEKEIFGQRTIRISNGVDFDALPLRVPVAHAADEIHLIGVAEVHYWHGYDRLIHGLGEYYRDGNRKEKVHFHIVGGVADSEMYDSPEAPGFDGYIRAYGIGEYVHFHGQQFGERLDTLFNQADFAIGSLARHRTCIDRIKTLKNREYAARGIPFIYSETDADFEAMPYVLKAPADESPVDIARLIEFYKQVKAMPPAEIRRSILHLSWKEQMKQVVENVAL